MSKTLFEVEFVDAKSSRLHPEVLSVQFFDNHCQAVEFASLVGASTFTTYTLAGTQYLAAGSTLI
jgi:hypothetical protein